MTNCDFRIGINSDEKLKQSVPEYGFIHKITIKNYSSLSNKNIRLIQKFTNSMCHTDFFKMISPNPEHVRTQCNDF